MSEFSDKEVERLRSEYKSNPRQQKLNVLLTGESGTGKTHILRTARRPIHVDSFDPGGTKGLVDLIEKGEIIVDAEYESEDPEKPSKYARWKSMFDFRNERKYFDSIGTYCLDSCTLWSEAIMNWQLNNGKRPGTAPLWNKDYIPQKVEINKYMHKILDLPCDVVVTGHLRPQFETHGDDDLPILTGYRFLSTGQGAIIIPLLFDELWVSLAEERAGKVTYSVLTEKLGLYLAKTRIGRGVFKTKEEPNIKELLKKVKLEWSDKPSI